jgi:hypothetical protein
MQRQFAAQLANVEEEEEEETSTLAADVKPRQAKDNVKAPGSFPYPFAANKSKRIPLRPCRNCGNPLHYDRDCASWRSQGRLENKAPANRTTEVYNKAYIAMLEEDDSSYDAHCATFNTELDSSTSIEAFVVNVGLDADATATSDEGMLPEPIENTWLELPVNSVELKEANETPSENIYEPAPVWERPPGYAVQGVDAFKVTCYVNSLKEPATLAVGDSGAAPTLISRKS